MFNIDKDAFSLYRTLDITSNLERSKIKARGKKKEQYATRERILESALKAFSRKGYSASIREIAQDSGTTLPSLYYYFGSKEGLFRELMQVHFERFQPLMRLHEHKGGARDNLKALIVGTYMRMADNIEFIRLMRLIRYGPPQSAPPFDFEPYHREFHDYLKSMIRAGIKNGEFRDRNTDEMAWAIRGVMQVAAESLCLGTIGKGDRKSLENVLDLILDGFSEKESG